MLNAYYEVVSQNVYRQTVRMSSLPRCELGGSQNVNQAQTYLLHANTRGPVRVSRP
jgi:hypothetical protein